jgi:hypothetical protein
MPALKKIPGLQRARAGLALTALRPLQMIGLAATVLVVVGALVAALFHAGDPASARLATTIQIVLANVLAFWTVVFTAVLSCAIFVMAQGAAHVADGYPLVNSDRPAR